MVILRRVIAKCVPLELRINATPVRIDMLLPCWSRIPRTEEINSVFCHLDHREVRCEVSVGHNLLWVLLQAGRQAFHARR